MRDYYSKYLNEGLLFKMFERLFYIAIHLKCVYVTDDYSMIFIIKNHGYKYHRIIMCDTNIFLINRNVK